MIIRQLLRIALIFLLLVYDDEGKLSGVRLDEEKSDQKQDASAFTFLISFHLFA